MRRVQDARVERRNVLVRVDFNVPIEKGKITDDFRIRAALPTIDFLRKKGARVILISHLGRPGGKSDRSLSLKPVKERLEKLLKRKVFFADDCVGEKAAEAVGRLKCGDVLLLENLRFHEGEKKNAARFVESLASLGDVFVNDAFGVSHRKHASVYGVAKRLKAYAGLLVQKEVRNLSLDRPRRPFVALVGGAKVEDKLGVLKRLVKKADAVLVGGAMMFTFLKASGVEVGKSLVDEGSIDEAKRLLRSKKVVLPIDVVLDSRDVVDVDSIPRQRKGLDVGPMTVQIFSSMLAQAGTVFWNGPMGMVEKSPFNKGTVAVARAIASSGCRSVVGGGDTVAAIPELRDEFDHVSSGGGAALEFVEGRKLPGLKVLE